MPRIRVRTLNNDGTNPTGRYVVYWMTTYRRTTSNYALQRAADWARHFDVPLAVLATVPVDYPWATDRSHSFILDGLADIAATFAHSDVAFYAYVERQPGGSDDLVKAVAGSAAVVVTDDAPLYHLPHSEQTARRVGVLVEAVDHNGLLPLAATDRVFLRAYDLRRFMQRELPPYLDLAPQQEPYAGVVPAPRDLLHTFQQRWPSSAPDRAVVADLPLDHSVAATSDPGGGRAAGATLERFVRDRLDHFSERNHPDLDVASGLSPYLHFGYVSPHQVFTAVADAQDWSIDRLADTATGKRQGWWGMRPEAESFLDQAITWRELGYQAAARVPDNDMYQAIPTWAKDSLAAHASDPRPYLYSMKQLEGAETHDEVWNAAQLQLRSEGIIHNYLRMLWGKKILEWSRSPQLAHDRMFELNNRYALDGSDPNSVSGIHWVLGRYDRPWAPERSIFGRVRYMSSDAARRKLKLSRYLERSGRLF